MPPSTYSVEPSVAIVLVEAAVLRMEVREETVNFTKEKLLDSR